MSEIPFRLMHALQNGKCVLFVGAGIGRHMRKPNDETAPDGRALCVAMAERFNIPLGADPDLRKVSQLVELRKSRSELESFVSSALSGFEPDAVLKWITTIRWRAIFTTNYDDAIERAYEVSAHPLQTPVTMTDSADLIDFDVASEVPLYHIHGSIEGCRRLIITENDYAHYHHNREMIFDLLKREFALSTFLYIGYSNEDPNWRSLLSETRRQFFPSKPPQSFRVAPSTSDLDKELLRANDIETIDRTFAEFVSLAHLELGGGRNNLWQDSSLDHVPPDLRELYGRSPAPVSRLLRTWEYVNQAPFSDPANTPSFLRGDKANWALAAGDVAFPRDIFDDVFDHLLDYLTANSKRPLVATILAPAGYGTTTLLMQVAAKLVQEGAGRVYFHRPGTALVEGDVEFASDIDPSMCPIFVVDNASDFQKPLTSVIESYRTTKTRCIFLLGDRLNDWRQSRFKVAATEFPIEPLSDAECQRLVDCLATHGALGTLAPLPRELQVAAIKRNFQKELLVALREATEGRQFDAIIEDEFQTLPELARRLYATVCGLYQHGILVRDTLLADILDTNLVQLHLESSDAIEGVVVYEAVDAAFGHYGARARHRTIAKIVWDRCTDVSQRQDILLKSVKLLNFNYRLDARAFELLIRSDDLVDSIRTLEGRITFFESGCQKDPDNPYVRQHYARMLARAGQYNLALGQIDAALAIDGAVRVLHHTKGLILAELMTQEGRELGRRRLAASESEFRRCISMNDRDEYAYQSLAELYLEWAKNCRDEQEAALYLSKAEEALNSGFQKARNKEGLWIVSSEIEDFLGRAPNFIAALHRAIESAPGTIVARYILGKSYRTGGQHAKALDILRPIILSKHDEFRSFIEYSLALLESGATYAECAATLRLSSLHGLGDSRYVATLGGMHFMDSQFTQASDVFEESLRRQFPFSEANRVHFRPTKSSAGHLVDRFQGVFYRQSDRTYGYISSPGYPRFHVYATVIASLGLTAGTKVSFTPAFSARGPVAERISVQGSA